MTELNRRHNLASMPTINNNGESYIIPFDIYKEGYNAYDISNWFKGRVGDNGIPFGIRWYAHGRLLNVLGYRPFIEGQVGDYTIDDSDPDNPQINMAPDASQVHVVGDVDDCQEGGVAIYRMINQAMPQSGIFYGKIGFQGDTIDGTFETTSVDVVFKVLAGHMNMLGARKFYVSELEKAILEFDKYISDSEDKFKNELQQHNDNYTATLQKTIDDARNAYNAETKEAHDALINVDAQIKANHDNMQNLADHLADTEQQIEDHDIVTKPEYDEAISKIGAQINDRLSKMKTTPVGIADAGTLKSTYPNGADGMFVTLDNKHLWMYLNGQWTDAGPYESAQLDKQVEQSIGDVKSVVLKENLVKNGSFSDGTTDGAFGSLPSDNLHILNFINRNWCCLGSSTSEAYHGLQWWIDNPLKNLGNNYPFHIQFDLVCAAPMSLQINLVYFNHQNQRLGGQTIQEFTTGGWEFKHFDVQFAIDDKYIKTDHFYFQIVQKEAKPVQEMRVTGLAINLVYHPLATSGGNYIQNGDFASGSAYPAYSNINTGQLPIITFADKKWLDFHSDTDQAYQGLFWQIDNPLKDLGKAYPLNLSFTLATGDNMNLNVDILAYTDKGDQIGSQLLAQFNTQSWQFENESINFNVQDTLQKAAYFKLQIVQPDAKPISNLRITDLSLTVIYNRTAETDGNLIAESKFINGFNCNFTGNMHEEQLSVMKFADKNWLSITSAKADGYQGIDYSVQNPINVLGQNYPMEIAFNLMTAENMTLQLDVLAFDNKGKQVGSVFIGTIETQGWRATHHDYKFELPDNLQKAQTLQLQLIQPDKKAIKEIRVTDFDWHVIYDQSTTLKENLISNGNFADGSVTPATSNFDSENLSVITYLDKNWLKATDAQTHQYSGINFNVDTSGLDYKSVLWKFTLITAEAMNLQLDIQFFDKDGKNLGSQLIDRISTDASKIMNYTYHFALNNNADHISLQIVSTDNKPIKQIIMTDISLSPEFATVVKDQNEQIDSIADLETKYGLPIMRINGDVTGMDHDNAKKITYEYKNKNTYLTGCGTLKWQGSSSATLNKKGYRLKTTKDDFKKKDKIKVQPSWQKHSKFNLKAYYNDGLVSRDPISANVGAQVSASRSELPRDLIHEDNFGYIDGFPIILFINGEYQGLYSFNLTRPDFDYTKWAIIGNAYNDITQFAKLPADGVKLDGSDFESLNPDDAPTTDEKKAVTDLISWVINSDDNEFKRDLSKHFDIPSLIDYVVVTNILGARDAYGKNQVLLTWDGKIWYYQLYDLDCTYNNNWMGGKTFATPKVGVNLPFGGNNQLFIKFTRLYHKAICDRYRDVRQWCTPAYILNLYKQRINLIGQGNFDQEWAKWNDPSKDTEDFKQLQNDLYDHFKAADFVWLGNDNPENTTYTIKPDTPPAPASTPSGQTGNGTQDNAPATNNTGTTGQNK